MDMPTTAAAIGSDRTERVAAAKPIESALADLHHTATMLEDVVGSLIPELAAVLSPYDPEGDGPSDGCDAQPEPSTSEIAAQLRGLTRRLEGMRSSLQATRRRLEI